MMTTFRIQQMLPLGLARDVSMSFDDAGKLVSGQVARQGSVVFPVPLPPGVGGFEFGLGARTLDVSDPAIRSVAERLRSLSNGAPEGAFDGVYLRKGGNYVSVSERWPAGVTSRVPAYGQMHLPGAPTKVDHRWGNAADGAWVGAKPATPAALEAATLSQQLLRAL